MPPKKTLQVRRDEWTDEVVKVRRALEAAFTTHHLGPPCLPKLATPGSVAARPVYMETPKANHARAAPKPGVVVRVQGGASGAAPRAHS